MDNENDWESNDRQFGEGLLESAPDPDCKLALTIAYSTVYYRREWAHRHHAFRGSRRSREVIAKLQDPDWYGLQAIQFLAKGR